MHTIEDYAAIGRNKLRIHTTKWVNLKSLMHVTEARHKSLYTKQSRFYGIQKKANSRVRKQISDRWGLGLEGGCRQHYWVTIDLYMSKSSTCTFKKDEFYFMKIVSQ